MALIFAYILTNTIKLNLIRISTKVITSKLCRSSTLLVSELLIELIQAMILINSFICNSDELNRVYFSAYLIKPLSLQLDSS